MCVYTICRTLSFMFCACALALLSFVCKKLHHDLLSPYGVCVRACVCAKCRMSTFHPKCVYVQYVCARVCERPEYRLVCDPHRGTLCEWVEMLCVCVLHSHFQASMLVKKMEEGSRSQPEKAYWPIKMEAVYRCSGWGAD